MPHNTQAKIPAKIAFPHLLALAATGALQRLALSAGMRAWAIQPHSAIRILGGGGAVLVLTLLLLWQLRAIWRRRDSWALYLGAALLCILFYKVGNNRPELSPVELPLAILWASLLVMSWAVGLGIFHRRYE